MKFLNYLHEAYVGRSPVDKVILRGNKLVTHSTYFNEVFVNPSAKEINTFTMLRFIADNKTKKFFISSSILLHDNLVSYLQKEGQMKSTLDCFMGAGEVDSGKIVFTDYSPDFPRSLGGPRFKWATSYFTKESSQWVVMPPLEKG